MQIFRYLNTNTYLALTIIRLIAVRMRTQNRKQWLKNKSREVSCFHLCAGSCLICESMNIKYVKMQQIIKYANLVWHILNSTKLMLAKPHYKLTNSLQLFWYVSKKPVQKDGYTIVYIENKLANLQKLFCIHRRESEVRIHFIPEFNNNRLTVDTPFD